MRTLPKALLQGLAGFWLCVEERRAVERIHQRPRGLQRWMCHQLHGNRGAGAQRQAHAGDAGTVHHVDANGVDLVKQQSCPVPGSYQLAKRDTGARE